MIETNEFLATCDEQFVDLAVSEIHKLAGQAEQIVPVAPGVLRVFSAMTFRQAAATWQEKPPIFVRHICPVHVAAELRGEPGDAATLGQYAALELLGELTPDEPFSVQTRLLAEVAYRPVAINDVIAELAADMAGAPLDVRRPVQVISVVVIRNESQTLEGLMGISRAAENLSDWAGGVRRFAREEGQVSRSEFKLLEALETFAVDLPPRGVALDLGASPGGWTRVLRNHEQYVTAVDPGDLDPRITHDRGIRHLRMTAEGYLRDEPDQFDLIVNDMRMDGRDSARLMLRYAGQLYPHGQVIMTVKLPEYKPGQVVEHALEILAEAYEILGARQLFHNRNEITVHLRRKR